MTQHRAWLTWSCPTITWVAKQDSRLEGMPYWILGANDGQTYGFPAAQFPLVPKIGDPLAIGRDSEGYIHRFVVGNCLVWTPQSTPWQRAAQN